MTINLQLMASRAKRWAKALRNAPLVTLTIIVSLSLETFGWGYIFLTNTDRVAVLAVEIPMALVEAVIITATGLMALVAAFVAAERRTDPRPEQRRKAAWAQALAVALLLPPGIKAAEAMAYTTQVAEAHAYANSDQYDVDLENSRRRDLDSMVVAEFAAKLGRATAPSRTDLSKGSFWAALFAAAFLYGANMLAASMLWRAKPETPAERARREAADLRAEKRLDRRRKQIIELTRIEAEAAKNRPTLPSFIRGIFNGGRKAA